MKNKKILIVGGGIAGSSLAINLINEGVEVHLIDKGQNYSTCIAAGMVNPIVFRRMNLSWKVNEYYPIAINFYKNLESNFKEKLFHPIKIRRIFSSLEERNLWNIRIDETDFKTFLNPLYPNDLNYKSNLNKYGTGLVNAFWVDSKKYYELSHLFIEKHGKLTYDTFQFEKLEVQTASYKNEKYDSIVLCLGYENQSLTLFNKVPIQTTKGQLITIYSEDIPENESLNRKCFLIPKGNKQFIAGATYEWENTSLNTDAKAQKELIEKLKYVTEAEYQVVRQEAGIRPTMLDRRPVLGAHPDYPSIFIFNGLGTKGYLLAPGLASEMTNHILTNCELSKEYHISRFYS